MPFGITGFGAQQSYPAPQIFQALSLSGAPPLPPAPPYGNPNENLVPVARTGNPAFPANLTVVAHLTYQAVLNASTVPPLKPSTVAKVPVVAPNTNAVLTHVRPEVTAVPNTTNAVSAPNPAVAGQVQGPSSTGIPARIDLPEGLVSFQGLAAPSIVSSGADALNRTIEQIEQAERLLQQAAANPNAAAATSSPNSGGSPGGSTPSGSSGSPVSPGTAPAPLPAASTPAPASAGLVARIVQTVQSLAISAVYSAPVFSFSA